ncbi:MAG TPA: hypothetical protein VGQ99_21235 [Tepidisphaeraceae bacterium]|jgi:hypothetical protein|nr:hypothetical protein [Tepidisphaeraceae bacterium]
MIGADGQLIAGSTFATSQAHGQAHGAFGVGISSQAAWDRTFGRPGLLLNGLAKPAAIDGQGAQRASGGAIRVGHQSEQKMFLAEEGLGVAAGFGVGVLEGHAGGGGEIVDRLNGAFGGLGGFAAGLGLIFGLFFEPFGKAGFGNEPFPAQMHRRYHPIL